MMALMCLHLQYISDDHQARSHEEASPHKTLNKVQYIVMADCVTSSFMQPLCPLTESCFPASCDQNRHFYGAKVHVSPLTRAAADRQPACAQQSPLPDVAVPAFQGQRKATWCLCEAL